MRLYKSFISLANAELLNWNIMIAEDCASVGGGITESCLVIQGAFVLVARRLRRGCVIGLGKITF